MPAQMTPQVKRMSAKRGQSAAVVEPPEKSSPIKDLVIKVAIAYLCFYGALELRYLNALSPRGFNGFSDAFHLCGLSILVVDVVLDDKTCPGLSLKSLLLTELHLAVKVSYGFLVEYDVRFFDIFAFLGTLSIIVGFKGKSSYLDNQDNFKILYLVIPCALLSLVIHPVTSDNIWIGITIAFCCYLNSISMLPQLELMRKREIVDRLTSQYICLLGFQRLSYLGNLIIEILLSQGQSVTFLGYYRYLGFYDMRWAFMGVLLELVNGFILADYCYYYMTTDFDVRIEDLRLPSGVV